MEARVHRVSTEMLEERVQQQGGQIRDIASQISTLANETRNSISNLAQDTRKTFDTLVAKFEEQRAAKSSFWLPLIGVGLSTLFAAITMAAGLSFTILSLRVSPLEDKYSFVKSQADHTSDTLDKLADLTRTGIDNVRDKLATDYVSRKEIEAHRDDNKQQRDKDWKEFDDFRKEAKATYVTSQQLATEQEAWKSALVAAQGDAVSKSTYNRERIEKIEARLHDAEAKEVGRDEHNVTNANFQRQIDQINSKVNDLIPASTILKDMRDEIRDTRSKVIELEAERGARDAGK